ncbi:MAG: transporter [Planctomycetes bacterium]|nr:transporter [Planctomycetota bacterium]
MAESVLPTQEELTSPITWSNQPSGPPPRPFEPPVQTSFAESVQQALEWEDYTDESEKKRLQASRPPEDATVAQLIEWEKQKYPWIRPFYWSEDLDAPAPSTGEFMASTPSSRAIAIAKPFLWSNEEPVTVLPLRKAGDSRTVAFLQGDEELPLPTDNSASGNLFDSEGKAQDDSGEGLLGEAGEDEKGAIGEAETLGREPEDNSLQFLRADTVLMDPGQVQYDYGMTYSLFDRSIPFIVTSPAGTSVQLARFRRRELLVPLEIRYGLARRIQLFLNVPFGWSNTEIALGSFEEFENDGGLGDITFGGTFLMRQGNHEKSDAIMTLAVTAPTGQDPFGFSGTAPIGPSLGGGTWSIASSMLFVRNYDPVVAFYGFGTRQHFLREVGGVNFRPGGEYNYLMGVGFAINERITFSTRFNGAYVTETRLDGERIRGTIQEPMSVGLAMTVSKDKRLIEPFVNFGLTNDATDVRFGVTWTR